MTKLIIPALALYGFLWLAQQQPHEQGYDIADIERINYIVSKTDKQRALQELWNISDDEISRPVNLFNNNFQPIKE